MKYIKITNDGEIQPEAFTLIGASTKRGDESKIGFFGSGLKYALAVLLRNGIKPIIYSGQKKIEVETRATIFRDQTFNQIFIGGQPTSLTTEMGIDWEPWFSIRELYCNAIDEGNGTIERTDEAVPQDGKTLFFIENNEIFNELIFHWNKYFTNRREDLVFECPDFKIYYGDDDYVVYRRGVRCHHQKTKSLYHYDCRNIMINESRVLRQSIDSHWFVAECLAMHAPKEVVRNIYDNFHDHTEESMCWGSCSPQFNQNWLEVLGGRRIILKDYAGNFTRERAKGDCIILNNNLARALKKHFKNAVVIVGDSDNYGNFVTVEATAKQLFFIDQAKEFLAQSGNPIEHPIEICVFQDKSILGAAENNRILLAVDVFEHGKRQVALTILEEEIHLKYAVADCTREMQNLLFNKLLGCYEAASNVYL